MSASGLTRYRMTLEYDGGAFVGWQRQAPGLITVQGVVETALAQLCGHPVLLVGAGRTDSGVHALGQVAHFDTSRPRTPDVFLRALNVMTPPEVSILHVEGVADAFNARRATWREYLYRILIRRPSSALDRGRVWHHPGPLDLDAMIQAASCLVGVHDFSAFRSANCQALTPIRDVTVARLEQIGDEIHFLIRGNAFLYHMVRNIVGSLIQTGRGKWTPERFQEVFFSKNHALAAPMAPPQGLYLQRVHYKDFEWHGSG
ncbi:MAG: tRNA pseudouridine(38-40) synthase TruA [Magnetococcales bacterium]|nr:tRNA pseudouridine(38-40) synthase TruA [Magnetococcales bacterium]